MNRSRASSLGQLRQMLARHPQPLAGLFPNRYLTVEEDKMTDAQTPEGKMPQPWCCGPCAAGNHAACLSTQPCDCPDCPK